MPKLDKSKEDVNKIAALEAECSELRELLAQHPRIAKLRASYVDQIEKRIAELETANAQLDAALNTALTAAGNLDERNAELVEIIELIHTAEIDIADHFACRVWIGLVKQWAHNFFAKHDAATESEGES